MPLGRRKPTAGEYILSFLGGALPGYMQGKQYKDQQDKLDEADAKKIGEMDKVRMNILIKNRNDMTRSMIERDESDMMLKNDYGIDLGVPTPKPAEPKEDTEMADFRATTEAFNKDRDAKLKEQEKISDKAIDPNTFRFTKEGTALTFQFMKMAEAYSKDYRTIQNNLGNIKVSINRLQSMPADERNKIAVNQAIITSYNKITDPTSVVRESEYERTPQGAALLNRLRGAYEKISQGGLLTEEDLLEISETATDIAEMQRRLLNEKLEQQIREPARKRYLDTEEVAPLLKPIGDYIKQPQKSGGQVSPTNQDDNALDLFLEEQGFGGQTDTTNIGTQ